MTGVCVCVCVCVCVFNGMRRKKVLRHHVERTGEIGGKKYPTSSPYLLFSSFHFLSFPSFLPPSFYFLSLSRYYLSSHPHTPSRFLCCPVLLHGSLPPSIYILTFLQLASSTYPPTRSISKIIVMFLLLLLLLLLLL